MNIISRIRQASSARALERFQNDENYRFLRENYLFADLSADAYLLVLTRLVERRYGRGEIVFKEDNPGVCLFVVKRGRVEVYSTSADGTKTVYETCGPGTLFGEMSIVSNNYRTASAKSLEDETVLLALSSFDLEYLNRYYPRDGFKVLRTITDAIADNLARTSVRLQALESELLELRRKASADGPR